MELRSIEYSTIVRLTSLRREKGQMFLPKAISDFVERYQFQKYPGPQDFAADSLAFQAGVFQDVGISEMTLYQDGIVVKTRARTDVLDAMLADMLQWAAQHGIAETNIPPRETHYESAVIVETDIDMN